MTSQCECASLSDYAGQGSGICEWCEAQNLTSAIGEALDDAICNGDGRPTAKHLLIELEHRGLKIIPVQDAEPAKAEQGAHISRPGPTA